LSWNLCDLVTGPEAEGSREQQKAAESSSNLFIIHGTLFSPPLIYNALSPPRCSCREHQSFDYDYDVEQTRDIQRQASIVDSFIFCRRRDPSSYDSNVGSLVSKGIKYSLCQLSCTGQYFIYSGNHPVHVSYVGSADPRLVVTIIYFVDRNKDQEVRVLKAMLVEWGVDLPLQEVAAEAYKASVPVLSISSVDLPSSPKSPPPRQS
jgi:hypothetical protein